MTHYLSRIVDSQLDDLVPGLPAIAIEGPKGVGKTETARRRATTVFALDDPLERELLAADPGRLNRSEPPVLVDEWQRHPPSWDIVRRAVDNDASPGRFLLTGSATPHQAPTHSGAGRIVSLRMRPLSLAERQLTPPTVSLGALLGGSRPDVHGESDVDLTRYTDEILRSGFPAIRCQTPRARRHSLEGYLARIVERDFPELGHTVRRPAALLAWLRAYAAATASTASYTAILRSATQGVGDPPAKATTTAYLDTLRQLWMLDSVPGWLPTRNHFKRLGQSEKHYLADPALAARLLGVDGQALLAGDPGSVALPRDGTLLGALFESLIALSVRVYAQDADATVHHLRAQDGRREVDLIVARDDQRVVALEVKLSGSVDDHDVRHLLWLREQMGDDLLDAAVITTGTHAYRRSDAIAVVPAALLGP